MCQELWQNLGRPIFGSKGVLTVSTENMCILKDEYKIKILSPVYCDRSNRHMSISPTIEQLYTSEALTIKPDKRLV